MHTPDSETETPQAPETSETPDSAEATAAADRLRERVIAAIKTCYDPEIPVDIYELGLIYDLDVDADGHVRVTMTLTSPMCPVAEILPPEVEAKVAGVPGVTHAEVDLTWEPPWHPGMMSEGARLELGFF